MSDQVETMFVVKKPAWHGKGEVLEDYPTAKEAIRASGLNWRVSKCSAYLEGEDGLMYRIPREYALQRDTDKRVLGTCGEHFQPLQNEDAFGFFDPFIQAGLAKYESAGSLQLGKQIWVLAKIQSDDIEVVKGDQVAKYWLLSNTHEAGTTVRAFPTLIRVVCANTLRAAIQTAQSRTSSSIMKANHSKQTMDRLEEIKKTMMITEERFSKTSEVFQAMAKRSMNTVTVEEYFARVFEWRNKNDAIEKKRQETFQANQRAALYRLFESGKGTEIPGVRGTLWGAYNAVTEYITHEAGRESNRLYNELFGSGINLNAKAFQEAEMVAR